MRHITENQMRSEGKVVVGQFGFGSPSTSGYIISAAQSREAVLAAYDVIREGDLSDGVLDGIIAAGGEFVGIDY